MNSLAFSYPLILSAMVALFPSDPISRTVENDSGMLSFISHMRTDTPMTARSDTGTPPLLGPSLRYGMDTTVSPCTDFYQYVNGDWRARAVLNGDATGKSVKIDAFSDTYVRAKQRLQRLLDSARAVAVTTKDPTLKALGTFYESCYRADSLERVPRRDRRDTMPARDSTRSEQCLQRTIANLGGALGQTFAKELLVSNARTRMEQLIEAIRAAVIARLAQNRWMTSDEKTRALERLRRLHLRIGMPKEMDDYQPLVLAADQYEQNKTAIRNFASVRWAKSIGGNHLEQWKMSLLTPNASYNFVEHAIEIPAVMFMPPFFEATGEDVVNFAGVGYVLGHEIFHSLSGQLNKIENPEMKTQIEQFKAINSGLGMVDQWSTDGQRTYGEDIADLGGVLVAYDAWQATMKAKKTRPAAVIDGLTPDQRFFLALGRIWRAKWRGKSYNRDSHSAPFARVNAMVMQSPMFPNAFGCTDRDPMVLPLAKRATIW